MILRITDDIILNVDHMVMAERHREVIKFTCANSDIITLNCKDVVNAKQSMDRIMDQTT